MLTFTVQLLLGYAIIQLPELVPLFYRFMNNRIFGNSISFQRKDVDSKRMKKSDLFTQGDKTMAIEGNMRDELNSFKRYEESIIIKRLSQLELQVTSILKRIDYQESKSVD